MGAPTPLRLLILGGTGEALALAKAVAADARFAAVYSIAGRTRAPRLPPLPVRTGGFGGVDGLAAFLRADGTDLLVDATHPFAAQMSRHAVMAADRAGLPVLAVRRPAWVPGPGDDWTLVANMPAAAAAIGPAPRRVLLTIGQIDLAPFHDAPQHDYVVRSVEPPAPDLLPPRRISLIGRGPFTLADERRLLADHRIELMVTKNSGGAATAPKLVAARERGTPVIMVARPVLPAVALEAATPDAAFDLLCARHAGTDRGV